MNRSEIPKSMEWIANNYLSIIFMAYWAHNVPRYLECL